MKRLLSTLILVVLLLVTFIPVSTAHGAWYSTYAYRQKFTVTGVATTVANYQTLVHVHTGAGTSSGSNIFLASHALDFPDDIRFTKSDGSTLVHFWTSNTTATDADIWVELDAVPASGTADFYIYYGKAADASASSIANTMIVGDDFEGGTDGNALGAPWTVVGAGTVEYDDNDTITPYQGTKIGKLVQSAVNAQEITIPVTYSSNISITYLVYKETAACIYMRGGNGTRKPHLGWLDTAEDDVVYYDTGWNYMADVAPDQWRLWELNDFKWNPTYTYDYYVSGSVIKNDAAMQTSATNANVWDFYNVAIAGADTWIDSFYVRNWLATEPSITAWTAEEAGVFTVAPTVTTQPAYDVTTSNITFSGNITDVGMGTTNSTGFEWDTNSGVPYTNNHTAPTTLALGLFSETRAGLTPGELYYWRAYAFQDGLQGVGSENLTLTKPFEPNSANATAGAGWINVGWVAGTGADNTTVVAKLAGFPANRADGTVIYSNTGTSINMTGLGASQNWHFSIWSWVTEGGLVQWSDTYVTCEATTDAMGPPTNFLITQVSPNSANLSWTPDPMALTTYIRYKVGSYPTSVTDNTSFLADNTTLTSIGMTGLSLSIDKYYFRAWSWDGTYSALYAEGTIGGTGMASILFVGFIILCLGLTIYQGSRRGAEAVPWALAAMMSWLTLGLVTWLSPDTIGFPSMATDWVKVIALLFGLLTVIPALHLFQKDEGVTRTMRDGNSKIFSTTEQKSSYRFAKPPTLSSRDRQTSYSAMLASKRKK